MLEVSHPNESLYIVKSNSDFAKNTTLVLSQSFNPGWKAYEIKNNESGIMNNVSMVLPFLFGKEIKEHVLVNNWENGWIIDDSRFMNKDSRLVIVFLPQYLEYFGFFVLILTFIIIITSYLRTKFAFK